MELSISETFEGGGRVLNAEDNGRLSFYGGHWESY